MITDLLIEFQANFLEKIKTKNSWGKNELKEEFDKEFTRLLMNILKNTLHKDL